MSILIAETFIPPPPMMPPPPPSVVIPKAGSGVNIAAEVKGATKVVLLKVGRFVEKMIFNSLFKEYGWTG